MNHSSVSLLPIILAEKYHLCYTYIVNIFLFYIQFPGIIYKGAMLLLIREFMQF